MNIRLSFSNILSKHLSTSKVREFDSIEKIRSETNGKTLIVYKLLSDFKINRQNCYSLLSNTLLDSNYILFIVNKNTDQESLTLLSTIQNQRHVPFFATFFQDSAEISDLDDFMRKNFPKNNYILNKFTTADRNNDDSEQSHYHNIKDTTLPTIAIQANALTTSPHTGTSRFVRSVISPLFSKKCNLLLLTDSREFDREIMNSKLANKHYCTSAKECIAFNLQSHVDLIHQPYQMFNMQEVVSFSKYKRRIISLLDLILFKYPQYFPSPEAHKEFQEVTKKSLEVADVIHSISKANKNDLVKTFEIDPDKITVIYPGISIQLSPQNITHSRNRNKRIILYVGSDFPHKNTVSVINGFIRYLEISGDTQSELVMIIKCFSGGDYKKLKHIKTKSKYSEQIQLITEYVTDEILSSYYKTSWLHINFSEYEGFGYTPLEAGTYNLPSLLYANETYKETMENSAFYCNSFLSQEIADQIELLTDSPEKMSKMSELASKRAQDFSWNTFSNQLFEMYTRVLDQEI